MHTHSRVHTLPQAVLWIYTSWRDSRARDQIQENYDKLTAPGSNYTCENPCQSTGKAVAGGCCDGVRALRGAGAGVRASGCRVGLQAVQ